MKYIKMLAIFLPFVAFLSCDEEVETSSITPSVTLVNVSDSPCYMWFGHSTTPSGSLIPVEGSYTNTVTLVTKSYKSMLDGEPYTRVEDNLRINVAEQNGNILFANKENINMDLIGIFTLRIIWDGDKITIQTNWLK